MIATPIFISLTDSLELTKFIEIVREGIEKSVKIKSFELLTPVEFEVSVMVKKEGEGGINLVIVDAGGKYEKESVSKIKFSMGNVDSWDQINKAMQAYQISQHANNEALKTGIELIKSQTKT